MGEVIELDPTERLVAALRADLVEHGSVQRLVDELADLGVDDAQWRGAARRAARELGRPVQTGHAGGWVWAALRDWPADEAEQVRHQQKLRQAVEAASVTLDPDEL